MPLKKIVVIGPESTGKSTLCSELANHYATLWVKEYARAYLLAKGKHYEYEDLKKIAEGQLQDEDRVAAELERSNSLAPLFIDTDMYVMKVWSEFVFGKCDNSILTEIARRKYDLYLLCDIDLPWTADELREYPDLETRRKLFHFYQDALIHQPTPWVLIHGNYEERLQLAIQAVDGLVGSKV